MVEITVVCEICGSRFSSPDILNEHWKSEHAICYGVGSHYLMIHHPNGFSDKDEETIQRWMKKNHLPIEREVM